MMRHKRKDSSYILLAIIPNILRIMHTDAGYGYDTGTDMRHGNS